MLFDRQLYGHFYRKADVTFQHLLVLKSKRPLTKPKVKLKISGIRIAIIPALSVLIIMTTTALCYFLMTHDSLEVYRTQDDSPNTANVQINQLLIGEQLRPPPSPSAELFAELEAEVASYQATQIEEGYWPEAATDAPLATTPLILPEPNISDLQVQDHTTGYSGDILASHITNGHINIKNADRNWNKMNSEFVQRLLAIYKVMSDQYGYEMVLLEGYRSPGRQAKLLKQGTHVTKAGSYKSYHQFGLAGDSAFIRNGKIVITEKDPWAMQGYKLYGQVAKSAGLVWGGDWRMMDLGHVELRKKGVLGRPQMAEILTSQ
ncbi:M15 family metallopeptidase [Psychrobacter sp. DAB_AL32B]|uniref:M15 family metallopeptidase n=1 Tax=Psychrobacter sp. DAB_AL32B TaxID=1028414 RepID=UPI001C2C3E31|nr:M15 family metallopeptidase [Psychrobacter sp. DAB_AL32B]